MKALDVYTTGSVQQSLRFQKSLASSLRFLPLSARDRDFRPFSQLDFERPEERLRLTQQLNFTFIMGKQGRGGGAAPKVSKIWRFRTSSFCRLFADLAILVS